MIHIRERIGKRNAGHSAIKQEESSREKVDYEKVMEMMYIIKTGTPEITAVKT